MPASAANIDWERVLRRVAAGESPSKLAKELPVTRQAIEKRYRRHVADRARNGEQPSGATGEVAQVAWLAIVQRSYREPAGTKDTPERRAEILQAISEGVPKNTAARSAGISDDTLNRWSEQDETFAAQIAQAQSQWQSRVAKRWEVKSDLDWRAAQALLQSHPDSRSEWGQNAGGDRSGITVVINVPDPQAAAEPGMIIDIEPDEAGTYSA